MVWSAEELGALLCVGCDTTGTVYMVAGDSLYEFTSEKKFQAVRKLIAEEEEREEAFNVYSVHFSYQGQMYISSNWYGIQIFQKARQEESEEEDILFQSTEWRGPLNLSHPSGQLVGVNFKDQSIGIMSFVTWHEDSQEATIRPFPAWGGEHASSWLWPAGERDSIYSIRRAWYSDRIMVYLSDQVGFHVPEDGIRSLHMMKEQGSRNISHLEHTYMSCPWEDEELPFGIEIPHSNVSSELLLFTPKGVITERGEILLAFEDYNSEDEYSMVYTATDIEGAGAKRNIYVLGLTSKDRKKNMVRILSVANPEESQSTCSTA